MTFINPQKTKDLWIHLTLIGVSAMALLLLFFYVYLPAASHHGEIVTVPNIEGMDAKEIQAYMDSKKLHYTFNDTVYKANTKPLTVLKQYPVAGTQIKKDRNIQLTLSSATTPKVKMPKLVDFSLRQAELKLQENELILDNIQYIPGLYHNVVMKQLVGHKEIPTGTIISKGTKVTLLLGNGEGS